MRHLIAQGLKQRKLVKTMRGFIPIRNLGFNLMLQRPLSTPLTSGHGVGHQQLTHSQLIEKEIEGEGMNKIKQQFNKLRIATNKAIKPLKFRI